MSTQEQATPGGGALFIVLEGVDGAGTTTLMHELVAHFRQQRRAVHGTCEPTAGPIGSLIRQALSRRFVVQGASGAGAPGWTTMALLFAADRQDHLQAEILPLLQDGVSVICDRYDLSSLAYQSATAVDCDSPDSSAPDPLVCPSQPSPSDSGAGQNIVEWIRTLNRYSRRPDLTLVVDVDPDVAAQRRRNRGGRSELYDDQALQRRLCDAYRDAQTLTPGDRIVHLDGNRSAAEVLAAAIAAIDGLRRA